MPALNIIDLVVDAKTHTHAKIYASLIEDLYQRKRAYASIVALYSLANRIEKSNANVQKAMTLFKHPKLNEEFEIADFYVNNWHVDVRVIVDGDAVLLPKKHYDNNILPDFYAVVKVDKSLNNASLLGFIDPKTVNKQVLDYHYFSATIDSLISYAEFLQKVENLKVVEFAEEEHQKFKEKYLNLLDEELDIETKGSVIRHMLSCPMCRTDFCCFTGFEMVSSNMGKYPDLMEDYTLSVVGATDVDNPKYEGKEQIIPITDEAEQELAMSLETQKEVLSENETLHEDNEDIFDDLDDLMILEQPEKQSNVENVENIDIIEQVEDVENNDVVEQVESIQQADDSVIVEEPLEELNINEEEISLGEQVDDSAVFEDKVEDLEIKDENEVLVFDDNDGQDIVEEQILIPVDNDELEIIEGDTDIIESIEQENDKELPISNDDILNEYFVQDVEELKEADFTPVVEEQEETVSDILDKLFSIDEEIEEDTVQEKSLNIEPKQENIQGDLQLLDENGEQPSVFAANDYKNIKNYIAENNDLAIQNQNDELEEIVEYTEEIKTPENNVDIKFNDDEKEKNEEFGKIEDFDEGYENIDIQNVIVDYDEIGNPIYSYITDISEDQISNIEENYEMPSNSDEQAYQQADMPEYKEENQDDFDILDEQYQSYSSNETQKNENMVVENTPQLQEVADETPMMDDYDENSVVGEVDDSQVATYDEEEYQDDSNSEYDEDAQYQNNSEFDDEEYIDETDESIPEENISKGNPLVGFLIFIAFIGACGFGGYKAYQKFFPIKTEKIENVVETNDIISELNTEEMLATTEPSIEKEAVPDNVDLEETKVENPVEVKNVETKSVAPVISSDAANLPKLPDIVLSDNNPPALTEKDLLSVKENSNNINKSMASAFSANSTAVTVKNINWLCTPQLFTDASFKAFLQDVDSSLKLNMRKNILNATENPKNSSVGVKMAIDNSGKIEKILISESSGSEQIDNIVLQSINESLTVKKSPILKDGKLKADRYHLKVVIKL